MQQSSSQPAWLWLATAYFLSISGTNPEGMPVRRVKEYLQRSTWLAKCHVIKIRYLDPSCYIINVVTLTFSFLILHYKNPSRIYELRVGP